MSRPKPNVILEKNQNGKRHQVIEGTITYAVYYDNKPINIKIMTNMRNIKYKKTSFIHAGHAYNLAKKLNLFYNTNMFTVVELTR